MAKKNVRSMKVCGQSGYQYETVPAIRLRGKWLEELGFHIGDYVQVKCENGQLIITPDENMALEQEATNLCKVITEQLTETFEGQIRIFKSVIPNTVKVGESIYYGEPLLEYAPENKACRAYQDLAEEVIRDES